MQAALLIGATAGGVVPEKHAVQTVAAVRVAARKVRGVGVVAVAGGVEAGHGAVIDGAVALGGVVGPARAARVGIVGGGSVA